MRRMNSFRGISIERYANIYRAVFILGALVILALPIGYYCEGRIVYSTGPSTMAAYAVAFIVLVSTIVMAIIGGRKTSRRRQRVIILWQLCWIIAAFIQFLRADLLVVSFAAALGIVIVYAELENPNEGIDRVTGQFTSNALYTYVADLYRRGIGFSAMHLSIDYSAGDFDLELETETTKKIAYFLDAEKKSHVFRESDQDFVVVYENQEEMNAEYERASSDLEQAVDMHLRIAYTLIPDSGILENADEFMQFLHYKQKAADFSNCVVANQELANEMRDRLKIRDQISRALANGRVEVYYQPIYNVAEKAFTSAEALARIRNDEGDLIMPGRFIPIAEASGLIIPLGLEVFRQVCQLLATGKPQELGIQYIEVNLSMAQFNDNEPAKFVEELLTKYHIDPSLINLEVTETADPATRQIILNNMKELKDMGVHFSLDDFGTGRSNFDYLVAMPVDIIKFDYKFTHWYFESEKSKNVMKSIVDIVENMSLPIVMEGVETKEELEIMTRLGASYIQGYYFSEPLNKEDFIRFLQNRGTGE